MLSRRVLSPSAAWRLSQMFQAKCHLITPSAATSTSTTACRLLSTTSGGGDDDDKTNDNQRRLIEKQKGLDRLDDDDDLDELEDDSDPFGVRFQDGDDSLGPQLPPKYKRDAATGKFTGQVEKEMTEEERRLLNLDPLQRDRMLLKRLVSSWKNEDDGPENTASDDFARRVRLAQMSLNVLGRSTKAQAVKTVVDPDTGETLGRDKAGFTQPWTASEFEAFKQYIKNQHHGTDIGSPEDNSEMVHEKEQPEDGGRARQQQKQRRGGILDDQDIQVQGITDNENAVDPDNPDLSLKWLTSRAQWEVHRRSGGADASPFEDLMPRDLNISKIVNRRRAKRLPDELLHHNNLALLRRYLSPTGQIMHRIRTRLGATDQRKIARLIKRSRNLGLIPHSGQFAVEDHGNIFEKDLHKNKPWEDELIRRGLVIKRKAPRREQEVEED